MRGLTIAMVGVLLLLCGCGTALTSRVDPVSGATITEYSAALPLTYEGEGSAEVLSFFSAQDYQNNEYSINVRMIKAGDSVDARAILEFRGEDWMFLESATILFTDGTSIQRSCDDPYRDVVRGGVFERLSIPIDNATLRALCEGRVSMIRLVGSHLYEDCMIPDGTQRRLRAMWDDLVQKHPELLDAPAIEAVAPTGHRVD
ncbi:MAG TPA: hypothetical protein PLS25_02385 [Methanoregulaceae archaeon]|nr:hypothetical protein [Methanoregulaceae archaeon]